MSLLSKTLFISGAGVPLSSILTLQLTTTNAQSSLLQDLKNLAFPAAGSAGKAQLNAEIENKLNLNDNNSNVMNPNPNPIPQQQPAPVQDPQQVQMVADLVSRFGSKPDQDGVVSVPEYAIYTESVKDMDLMCLNNSTGSTSQQWFFTSQKFRYILGPDASFKPLDRGTTLEPAFVSIIEDMGSLTLDDYCGTGKLLVQLLNILILDSGNGELIGQMLTNENLMSPIMTLLLDVPWMAYQPHWPLFGILAQMAVRRQHSSTNTEEQDGLVIPELQQYAQSLNYAILSGDVSALKELSQAFLDAGPEAVAQSPLGFLTAVFTRAAVSDVFVEGSPVPSKEIIEQAQEDGKQLFFEAQKVLRRLLSSPQELDLTLSTRWPLWGMAYLASLKL